MKKCGIYKLTSPSGKIYIGQSIRLPKRLSDYNNLKKIKGQTALYEAVKKYGFSNFKVEIIFVVNEMLPPEKIKEVLNVLEEVYIEHFNCMSPNGYNLRSGGNSMLASEETKKRMSAAQIGKSVGRKMTAENLRKMIERNTGSKRSEETKNKIRLSRKNIVMKPEWNEKISNSKKGVKLSDEHRANISKGLKASGWKMSDEHKAILSKLFTGRKASEETKQKQRAAKVGKSLSEEHRKKIGEGNRGKTLTDEQKARIGLSNKGKVISDEHKKKLSIAHTGRIISVETREKISKSLTGMIYPEERRKNISKGRIGIKHSEETKAKMRKRASKVLDVNSGIIYENVTELSKKSGISKNTLKAYLNGNNKKMTNFKYLKKEQVA